MDSEHNQLLFHSEVCWLFRGNVLFRLYEMRSEIRLFFIDRQSSLSLNERVDFFLVS